MDSLKKCRWFTPGNLLHNIFLQVLFFKVCIYLFIYHQDPDGSFPYILSGFSSTFRLRAHMMMMMMIFDRTITRNNIENV